MNNGLYNGLDNGLHNGVYNGMLDGLKNGFDDNETAIKLNIVTRGLKFRYDFFNKNCLIPNSSVIKDLSGNGNNATIFNNPGYNSKYSSYGSLTFNGTSTYINTNYQPLVGLGAYSMSCWIKTSFSQLCGIIGFRGVFGVPHLVLGIGTLGFIAPAGTVISNSWNGGTQASQVTTKNYNDSIWHNIHFSHTPTSDKLYVDGVLYADILPESTSFNVSSNVFIGCVSAGNVPLSGYYYKGEIGAACCYNVELTNDEVLTNYNALKKYFLQ